MNGGVRVSVISVVYLLPRWIGRHGSPKIGQYPGQCPVRTYRELFEWRGGEVIFGGYLRNYLVLHSITLLIDDQYDGIVSNWCNKIHLLD
jgi:hypothetical protein